MPEKIKTLNRKFKLFQMRSILTFLCCMSFLMASSTSWAQGPGDERCDRRNPNIKYDRSKELVKPATCPTACDGVISLLDKSKFPNESLILESGTAPFTFFWYYQNDQPRQTTLGEVKDLCPGIWTLVIRDVNNVCSPNYVYEVVSRRNILNGAVGVSILDDVHAIPCRGSNMLGTFSFAPDGVDDIDEANPDLIRAPYGLKLSNTTNTVTFSQGNIGEDEKIAFDKLPIGKYFITVTDTKKCENTYSFEIKAPEDIALDLLPINETCSGTKDGALNLKINGGTNGNSLEVQLFRIQPSSVSNPDPILTLNLENHVLWNNSIAANLQQHYNLEKGNYWVRVRSVFDPVCYVERQFTVLEPAGINVTESVKFNCTDQFSGQVMLTVNGGLPPYTGKWTREDGRQEAFIISQFRPYTSTIKNLVAGTYMYSVTDANGCVNVGSVEVDELRVANVSVVDETCNKTNDATATVSVLGGSDSYSYVFKLVVGNEKLVVPSVGNKASNLRSGIYEVSVSDNKAEGCTTVHLFEVKERNPISLVDVIADVKYDDVYNGKKYNVSCHGSADGQITLTSNGRRVAEYVFSNGRRVVPTSDVTLIGGLAAGKIDIIAYEKRETGNTKDDNCFTVQSVTLLQPEPITSSAVVTDVSCKFPTNNLNGNSNDGKIVITINGGSKMATDEKKQKPVYEVALLDFAHGVLTPDVNFSDNLIQGRKSSFIFNTVTYSDLKVGTYLVFIRDVNKCVTEVETLMVGQPKTALKAKIKVKQPILCSRENNNPFDGRQDYSGILEVDNTNYPIDNSLTGTPPYKFYWSLPTGVPREELWKYEIDRTKPEFGNLPAGEYIIHVVDAKGCFASDTITLTEPQGISVQTAFVGKTELTCQENDKAIIEVSFAGGSGNPANYEVQFTPQPPLMDLDKNFIESVIVDGKVGVKRRITNIPIGTFRITVLDANGCRFTRELVVKGPAGGILGIQQSLTEETCFGSGNGSVVVTPVGGLSPYMYRWRKQSTGEVFDTPNNRLDNVNFTIKSNSNGEYEREKIDLFVTDRNGCTYYAVIDDTTLIPTPLMPLSISKTVTNVSCFNGLIKGRDGMIVLNVEGGREGYSYKWSHSSETTNEVANLGPGIYQVTITDNNGCEKLDTVRVGEPALLTAQIERNGCNTLIASSVGGNGGSSYLWSNGSTSESITVGDEKSTYTVTVTDSKGCFASASHSFERFTNLTLAPTAATICGEATGRILVTATGGIKPYIAHVISGKDTMTMTSLNPRFDFSVKGGVTYSVYVMDAAECLAFGTVEVNNPAKPVISLPIMTVSPTCSNRNDGVAEVKMSTTGNYAFSWFSVDANGVYSPIEQSGSTSKAVNLPSGNYVVQVMDLATRCVSDFESGRFTIAATPALVFTKASIDQKIRCFNSNDGVISFTTTGGSGEVRYQVTKNDLIYQTLSSSSVIENLGPGKYRITAVDANKCVTVSGEIELTEPVIILTNASNVKHSCKEANSGSFDLSISGGRKKFDVAIVRKTAVLIDTVKKFSTEDDIRNTITGLAPGQYTVVVNDFEIDPISKKKTLYCLYQEELVDIYEYDLKESVGTVTCDAGAKYNAEITLNGKVQPASNFTYRWNDGITTAERSFNGPGQYLLTVNVKGGCTQVFVVNVTQFDAFAVASSCQGEQRVVIKADGGKKPYMYTLTVDGTTINRTTFEDMLIITDATFGVGKTVSVSMMDANRCTLSQTVVLNAPNMTASVSIVKNVTCKGGKDGQVALQVFGGASPFTYSWSHNVGLNSASANDLPAGSFVVTVVDANGCEVMVPGTVSEPPKFLLVDAQITNTTRCDSKDGAIKLNVTSGQPPYNYVLTNSSETVVSSGLISIPSGGVALSVEIANLASGVYSAKILDASGCVKIAKITVNTPEVPTLAGADVRQLICRDGNDASINVTITGGKKPYMFAWSNGSTSEDLTNLSAGSYQGTITDANGCVLVSPVVTISNPRGTRLEAKTTSVTTCGFSDGSIVLTAFDGNEPYSYSWSNGATTANLSNVPSGDYTVTVIDAINCKKVETYYVGQPNMIDLSSSNVEAISCNGQADGRITVAVTGTGVPPFTFRWSNNETTTSIDSLAKGTYTVTVTDNQGCYRIRTFEIIEPAVISLASAVVSNVTCNGRMNGGISIQVEGGTPPYSYRWSNGSTAQNLTNVAGGTYTGTITDSRGCTFSAGATVGEPAALAATFTTVNAGCTTGNDGSITANVTGGTRPYSFKWSNGGTTETISGLGKGSYTGTITDANGCSISATEVVNTEIIGTKPTIENVGSMTYCAGEGKSVQLVAKPSDNTYSYLWKVGEGGVGGASQSIIFDKQEPGVYKIFVTITTPCGEANSDTVTVTVVSKPATPVIERRNDTLFTTAQGNAYQWFRKEGQNNEAIAGATNSSLALAGLADGQYFVRVTNEAGCASEESNLITGIENSVVTIPLSMYPNPTNSNVTLQATWDANTSITINVYNKLGQVVYTTTTKPQVNGQVDVNLSNISAGIYSVRVNSNAKVWTGKIVKE